jgi:two-component system, NarL family, sensor histidine kinase UhpB
MARGLTIPANLIRHSIGRQPSRWHVSGCPRTLVAVLLLLCAVGAPVGADNAVPIRHADFLLWDGSYPPPDHAPGWEHVSLADSSRTRAQEQQPGGRYGWYRLHLDFATPPDEPWSVHLPRLSTHAALWLNGELIGGGGRTEEVRATRSGSRPLLLAVPPSLWREGENVIHVRLPISHNDARLLAPVEIGPTHRMSSELERHRFLQDAVSAGLFFITSAAAAFMLGLWARLRHERMYLLFGASALAWSIFSLDLVALPILYAVDAWRWLVHAAMHWWVVLLAMFVHRFVGIHRPRLEGAMLAFATAGVLAHLLLPSGLAAWYVGAWLIGCYIAVVLASHWLRAREAGGGTFAVMVVALLVLGARDGYTSAGGAPDAWLQDHYLLHFAVPLMFLAMTWYLTSRSVCALHETRGLAETLDARVAAAREDLERRYAERVFRAREDAACRERERLMRDLHDDVGAKLLTLIYRAESESNANLARSVLEDIRRVVSRPHPETDSLHSLLAAIEGESRERLGAAGIELAWEVDQAVPDVRCSPEAGLDLVRILREAVSNILRHAVTAYSAVVHVLLEEGRLAIEITDDGQAADIERCRPGRGMRNMTRRVQVLGGQIAWRQAEGQGCHVSIRLSLPLVRREREESEVDSTASAPLGPRGQAIPLYDNAGLRKALAEGPTSAPCSSRSPATGRI